jgi:subtilisin-like proprotein convertase family protein
MKKILCLVMCGLGLGMLSAPAGIYYSSGSPVIPDANPVGITSAISVGDAGTIGAVSVTLNLSGGNIGDLYAYLTFNGTKVDLMNQPGGGTYLGGSFNNVTLSDGAYANVNSLTSGDHINETYNASSGSTAFQAYNGMSENGNWTLFFADLSGGDGTNLTTLNSWSLNITEVPEPVTLALGIFGGALATLAVVRLARRCRTEKVAA